MRILFLSRWFPYPPDNGSKIRIFNVIRQLAEQHDVAVLAFGDPRDLADERAHAALREFCASVDVIPFREFRPSSLQATIGLLSRQPRSLVDTFVPEMAHVIREQSQHHPPDLIVASQLHTVPYALAEDRTPAIFEEVELTTFRDAVTRAQTLSQRLRASLTWLKLTDYLRRVLPRFVACTVASESERAIVRRVVPSYSSVSVVPNALDLTRYDGAFGAPRPNSLIFSGALTYHANYDALRYFLAEIYPLVQRAVPNVELRVTGDNRGVDLGGLPSRSGVHFTGYLDDIRPTLAQSWAAVVPIRSGGGTRLKILEAMALGTPVVSTSKGAEGIDVAEAENILLADSPADFASQVVSVLRSRDLRERLGTGGRRLVSGSYDWRAVGKTLQEIVARSTRSGLLV